MAEEIGPWYLNIYCITAHVTAHSNQISASQQHSLSNMESWQHQPNLLLIVMHNLAMDKSYIHCIINACKNTEHQRGRSVPINFYDELLYDKLLLILQWDWSLFLDRHGWKHPDQHSQTTLDLQASVTLQLFLFFKKIMVKRLYRYFK